MVTKKDVDRAYEAAYAAAYAADMEAALAAWDKYIKLKQERVMKIRKICKIVTALEHIADAQDTCIPEIVDALIGVCFDEEEAGAIKAYIADEEDV